MRPGYLPVTLVLLTLCSLAQHAQAQNVNQTTNDANGIPPVPSNADLQNNNGTAYPAVVPHLAPAPQLQPLRNPQDQAANQPQPGIMAPNMAPQNQNQSVIAPQLVPVNNSATAQAQNGASQQGTAAPATSTTTTTQETTTVPAIDQQQNKPTNTAGFSPQGGKNDTLPLNSGSMPNTVPLPTTNPGMDMSINPNIVGGVGQVDANGNPANTVPYEEQLRQRTQEIQSQARDMAYEQAKKSVLPMENYEIRDVLGRLKDTQEAIQTPVRPAPKPSNTIETISTDPSATPKIIRLATGNVTTLNIVDITGEPWPIVDLGFGGAFDIKPPEAGGHVIRITPLKDFARGNLVIRLLKMTTPITFTLQSGGDTVNYRFDARIPDYGPNAKMPLIGRGIDTEAGDKTTTAFLEGVPPKGADKLAVAGIDERTSAYKYGGTLYVRTPLTLISPAWQGSATSSDGMNVYQLTDAPVLLLSDKGELVRAQISDAKKDTGGF